MKQHGGRKDDCDIYAADFRHLIRAVSRANYNMRLINTVGRWTVEFQAYFYANINPEVELFSLWHAMELEFPTTDKIIFSSNMCETLNFMVKYIQDFKEVSSKQSLTALHWPIGSLLVVMSVRRVSVSVPLRTKSVLLILACCHTVFLLCCNMFFFAF